MPIKLFSTGRKVHEWLETLRPDPGKASIQGAVQSAIRPHSQLRARQG
jgi:hypothetical protein